MPRLGSADGDGGDWNYVALEHADGRMTIYGHLRHLSLTAKAIGQTVARGEVLGTAGSSGNSSGPHLHFEVRTKSFAQEWIDPFAGPHSQAESLWTAQGPYIDPAINLLAVHEGPPSSPDPCLPSVTRFKDRFATPANVYLYAYYRDFQGALPTEVRVHRPDGTLFRSWTYSDDTAFVRASSHAWVAQLAAGVAAGDEVDVDLELDTEPRAVAVPSDFAEALDRDAEARCFFDGLSYSHQRQHVLAIEDAKTPETRLRRIDKALAMLREGRK